MKIINTYIIKDIGNNFQFLYECENRKFFITEFVYSGAAGGIIREIKEINPTDAKLFIEQQS